MIENFVWHVPATVVRVVDGDTVEVHLDQGWRVYRNAEHIRLNGINAPERNTRAGKRAKAFAESLLPPGTVVLVSSESKPTFTRTVGSIEIPGRGDFGQLMVAAGHAASAASAAPSARDVLERLVGKTIRTVTGRPNTVLAIEGDNVIVAARSTEGKPVPIAWVEDALERVLRDGEIEISVPSLGYRSAFVGAVLLTLPNAKAVRTVPPRVILSAEPS